MHQQKCIISGCATFTLLIRCRLERVDGGSVPSGVASAAETHIQTEATVTLACRNIKMTLYLVRSVQAEQTEEEKIVPFKIRLSGGTFFHQHKKQIKQH